MRHLGAIAVLSCAVGAGLLGCSSSSGSVAPSASASPTLDNLVGTWTGKYTYPMGSADKSPQAIPDTEKLIIQKQEGLVIWGVDEFVDNGKTTQIPVRGTIDMSGTALTVTEEGGSFRAQAQSDGSLLARFTRTDSQFTSFEVTLTRS